VLAWLLHPLPAGVRSKAHDYLVLTRMDRPIGALLLLWPCWWALWLAAGDFPPPAILAIFTAGVFVMRMAGCAVNDFADRKLDPQVKRTAGRPLASGRVKPWEALAVFATLLLVAFGLVLLTNPLTVKLSFAGAALAAIYPFTKRYTHLPQVVLGAAFGWSIPMAFAAVSGHVPPLGWLLFLGNVLWSTIYDTEYAMVDREDDLKVGAKSTAILFGELDRVIIGMLMATFALTMALVGQRAHLSWPYWAGFAVAMALFVYQQWLIRHRERGPCLTAFRNNNWVGFALWLGMLVALAIR
jgi:4-hydroxybenzoate polyprenyltransferase